MREAYRLTRKDGAAGIDGVTAADYEKDLEANLLDLLGRIKSGRYIAPPVRRHYIPKADGTLRPLGIPTFEDKVAQRAIVMLLEPVCEADFLPCSHGFRPGRSAHDALHAVREGAMDGLRWVIDADMCRNISIRFRTSTCGPSSTCGSRTEWSARCWTSGSRPGCSTRASCNGPGKAPRKAVWSALCSPTCSCTMCWISGSSGR